MKAEDRKDRLPVSISDDARVSSPEKVGAPAHPTGETDPYWLPILQWDTDGGSWEASLGKREENRNDQN